jgi:Uma2 family endonuclease
MLMEQPLTHPPAEAEARVPARWVLPNLALRSLDATWDRTTWALLPDDGNRYEVIDGVLYMTTAPSSFHQWIVFQIGRMLGEQINDVNVGVTFPAPIGVFMPGCDPVQPDLVVVCRGDLGIVHDRHIYGVPALVGEVLSPSNADVDTGTKRGAYARCGVPEYWIVRPDSRDLLVLSQADRQLGDYLESARVPPDGDLRSPTLPIHTPIARFFAGAPDTSL